MGDIMTALFRHNLRHAAARSRRPRPGTLIAVAVFAAMSAACAGGSSDSASSTMAWGANSVTPAEFAKELAGASDADKPVVVCTAPAFLYRIGHIPGAVHHGPASSPEGLDELKAWAQTLPRSTNIVVYCGCCPLSHCPNLHPAYVTLKDMGFTRVRVLLLAENFKTDWIDRGFPYVAGQLTANSPVLAAAPSSTVDSGASPAKNRACS
jgi:hypothetical protein